MSRWTTLLGLLLLSACGMKGDLVLPGTDAAPAAGAGTAAPGGAPQEPPADDPRRQGVDPPDPDPTLTPP